VVVVALAGAAFWRWYTLSAYGEPVGVDFGNWLTLGGALGGHRVSGGDTVYPPVVPAIAVASAAVLGVPRAAHLVAAVAGVVPALGAWLAVRPSVGERYASLVALPLLVAGAVSAAVAWGGTPQLVGLGLAPLQVVLTSRLVGHPSIRQAALLGATTLALAATSPLVFGLSSVAAGVAALLASLVWSATRWIRSLPVVAAFLLPMVPTYARALSRLRMDLSGHGVTPSNSDVLHAVLVGGVGWWLLLAALALIAPILTWPARRDPLWAASTALSIVAVFAVAFVREARFAALVPTASVMGAALLLAHGIRGTARVVVTALVGVAAVGVLLAAPALMVDERDAYATFVPLGTGDAIRWLDRHSQPDDFVAVAPIAGVPFGWYVEGWARRPSYVAGDPSWLAFPGERARAAAATAVFSGRAWPRESSLSGARRLGVRWLYVPTGWHGIDPATLHDAERRHPGLAAYRGRGAIILRVPVDG
jgi:hypothetical protein